MTGETQQQGGSQGPATDRNNAPVIDPTANVLLLVEAAVDRIDDMRDAAVRRLDDLRDLESRNAEQRERLRAQYEDRLARAESQRIDAIRAVDVAAVQQAAQVASQQAQTLAAQVASSAETLRTQVQAAAQAATIALAAALEPVQKDIADLRRAQYEAQGQKTQVIETQSKGANSGLLVGLSIAGVSLLMTFVFSAVTLYVATH